MTADLAFTARDRDHMRLALRLARRGYGRTSPNPMVGAVLVQGDRVIGRGWHRAAGQPHAEIEALRDAEAARSLVRGATLYVTLEPCSTHGRTPPCVEAILAAGIRRVVVATIDPNPAHAGRGLRLLAEAGLEVKCGLLGNEAAELNAAFNHWIVHRTPLVTIKAAMTLDGKIATASGESKWITGPQARAGAMRLRAGVDAILVGVETVLADDPSLTVRPGLATGARSAGQENEPIYGLTPRVGPQRVILDSRARTPLDARVLADQDAAPTTLVVTGAAPPGRVAALARKVSVLRAPARQGRVDLPWLLRELGGRDLTSLLVEGGGEVNASFLAQGLAHRIAFFYAPKVLGGRQARRAVAGHGATDASHVLRLTHLRWRSLGPDLLLTARVAPQGAQEENQLARPPFSWPMLSSASSGHFDAGLEVNE